MARGKYKQKKANRMAQAQTSKVVKQVEQAREQVFKIEDAAEDLARIQAKWNAADKKGRKKLQKQLDKARSRLKAVASAAQGKVEEVEILFDEHEELVKRLEEEIRGIDWHGADPADFWSYSDSARTWANLHVDYPEGVDDGDLF